MPMFGLLRPWALAALLLAGCRSADHGAGGGASEAARRPYRQLGLPTFERLVGATFAVSSGTGAHAAPEVVYDPEQRVYLAVWRNEDDKRIYGQLLGEKGVPMLAARPLTPEGEDAGEPRLIRAGARTAYLLAYTREGGAPARSDVHGLRLNDTGGPIGPPFPIAWGLGEQRRPALAFDAVRRRAVVAWEDGRSGVPAVFCRAVALGEDGTPTLGAERLAGADVHGAAQTRPDIAYSAAGDTWLMAWEDARDGQLELVGQRLDGDARLKGPNYYLVQLDQAQRLPRLAWNAVTDRFLLVFEDESEGAADTNVRARQLNGRGMPAREIKVVSRQYGAQRRPRVAFNDRTARYMVTYDEDLSGAADVVAHFFEADGTPGDAFEVTRTVTAETAATVVANPALGEFGVFFAFDDGAGTTIRGQRTEGR